MAYTLTQAAEATGKSKSTLLRAIQSSKISAMRDETGKGWLIEPAELHRLYPPVTAQRANDAPMTHHATSDEIITLRRELALLSEERDRERSQLQERIDDLTRRLDDEAAERRRLTAILTDQRSQPVAPPAPEPRRSWWRFGKR